eukprot:GHVS01091052.1.p1 GENE.GHVS01091052.1~~GHVS01091052.1.p1  ORF type:complete len:314 (-),score=57.07 GHVS01091052.1:3-944(-)
MAPPFHLSASACSVHLPTNKQKCPSSASPGPSTSTSQLVIVVGCSSGLGRSIVQTANHKIGPAHYLLLGKQTEEMRLLSESIVGGVSTVHALDMSKDAVEVEAAFDRALIPFAQQDFSHIYLFLNSGSFDAGYIHDSGGSTAEASIALNVTSFYVIVAKFLQWAKQYGGTICPSYRLINISSLLAVSPFSGCGLYCASKSYREALMSVTSLETKETFKDFKCLSWAPGPMETNMMEHLRSSDVAELKAITSKPPDFYICPSRSAGLLWRVLREDAFKSGDRIDAFDIIETEQKYNITEVKQNRNQTEQTSNRT